MRYTTKADWAAAKAQDLRRQARTLPYVHTADWRGVRRRSQAVESLTAHARRFERLAERLKAEGK